MSRAHENVSSRAKNMWQQLQQRDSEVEELRAELQRMRVRSAPPPPAPPVPAPPPPPPPPPGRAPGLPPAASPPMAYVSHAMHPSHLVARHPPPPATQTLGPGPGLRPQATVWEGRPPSGVIAPVPRRQPHLPQEHPPGPMLRVLSCWLSLQPTQCAPLHVLLVSVSRFRRRNALRLFALLRPLKAEQHRHATCRESQCHSLRRLVGLLREYPRLGRVGSVRIALT